ncbi:MAG: nuclear transport factor 2 family protein [Acidimicrobiia bacterium]
MTPTDDPPIVFDGDSNETRDELVALYRAYWTANDVLKNEMLDGVYTTRPDAIYFNTNGHVYEGLDDWLNIWDYYRPRMNMIEAARGGKLRIAVRDDLAVMVDDHIVRSYEWRASEDEPNFVKGNPHVRMTFVCMREADGWRIVHTHFSERATGPRPDQIAQQS